MNAKSVNQQYNKTIKLKPHVEECQLDSNSEFDLVPLVYSGKLTMIADYFNKLSISECKQIVTLNNDDSNDKKSPLCLSAFLDFPNIFLYLLTFDADPFEKDLKGQTSLHSIFYKGQLKILWTLLNYQRYKIKIEFINKLDNLKKSFGFSKLDILKGQLSRAVNQTETNLKKFNSFKLKLREFTTSILKTIISSLENALAIRDMNGRTPLHYAAMSKYSLCYSLIYDILDYDFFENNFWEDFLKLFNDIQSLEIKEERIYDPRKSQRLERDLMTLMGDDIIKKISKEFRDMKRDLLKRVINTEDNLGDTVLHLAAFHGDYRVVNKLLDFGADKKRCNERGLMPVDMSKDDFVRRTLTNLNKAAKLSDEKNVTSLVHFGHNINDKISIFSQAPLHKVIESSKEDKYLVLKKMIDMGADLNIRDSNGWTALHYSAQYGDFEAVTILIQSKAEIDAYSNNHRTALHLAANKNFPKIVKFLLENGSDPNFKDHLGCPPSHLASKSGNTECLKILLKFNAKLYEEDFRKWNILHYAAFHGHHRTVRYICKYDADFDVLQTNRNSQCKLAIEIVRDPSVKPFFISLWHAAKEGDLDMTRQLLNDGEDINALSVFLKNTPLHLAVFNNHYLLVRLLLEHKAEKDIRNCDGITPVEYAEILNHAISKSKNESETIIDYRNFVRNAYNKNEKILTKIICEKNRNLKFWNVIDFSKKIIKLLK
jgi:ankyrin repeat protein